MTQLPPSNLQSAIETPLWGRLATCGPIVNRSIRAQPGRFVEPRPSGAVNARLNRHASACGQTRIKEPA
jgi:hypothetical protein